MTNCFRKYTINGLSKILLKCHCLLYLWKRERFLCQTLSKSTTFAKFGTKNNNVVPLLSSFLLLQHRINSVSHPVCSPMEVKHKQDRKCMQSIPRTRYGRSFYLKGIVILPFGSFSSVSIVLAGVETMKLKVSHLVFSCDDDQVLTGPAPH